MGSYFLVFKTVLDPKQKNSIAAFSLDKVIAFNLKKGFFIKHFTFYFHLLPWPVTFKGVYILDGREA